jgi:hypothetical protein
VLSLKVSTKEVDKTIVNVVISDMRVTGSRLDLEYPSSIGKRDTSKVPPPKSTIKAFFSAPFLSSPFAIAAAVSSLIMRRMFNPAIERAAFVA